MGIDYAWLIQNGGPAGICLVTMLVFVGYLKHRDKMIVTEAAASRAESAACRAVYAEQLSQTRAEFATQLTETREAFQSQLKDALTRMDRSQREYRDQITSVMADTHEVFKETVEAVKGLEVAVRELQIKARD